MKRLIAWGSLILILLNACAPGAWSNFLNRPTPQPGVQATDRLANPPAAPAPTQTTPATQTAAPQAPATVDPAVDRARAEAWADETLAKMSIQQKVGQVILTGIVGDAITPEMCEFLHDLIPAGVTFQSGNVLNPGQMRTFIQQVDDCTRSVIPAPLLLSISHEGEYVVRFTSGVTVFPAALAFGAQGDPQMAYAAARASGAELAYSGFNMVLAPVADVLTDYGSSVVAVRTYGGDPGAVSAFVDQSVRGYLEAGIIPVLKHFPGHGSVAEDSHETLPVDRSSRAEIQATHLPPFAAGIQAGAPVVMLSHIAYPKISDGTRPATFSPEVPALLRDELGFDGVILSDSMRMKAATGKALDVPKASLQALEAGVDLLLLNWPGHAHLTRDELLDAVWENRLDEKRLDEAVRRVLVLKALFGLAPAAYLQAPEPDWQANAALADEIGRGAVAVLRDEAGLLPLPGDVRRVLAVYPGEDWELIPALRQALEGRGIAMETTSYPAPWLGLEPDHSLDMSILKQAPAYDLVVVFTWQAHLENADGGQGWQAGLVQDLLATGQRLVVVAIKSPTDLLEFPQAPAFIAMYGSTPGQEEALIGAFTGEWTPTGGNPLPGVGP